MQKKTPRQLLVLEKAYASESNPNCVTTKELSKDLGLTCKQVQEWFYRRRVRTKEELLRKQSRVIKKQESKSSSRSELESKPRQSNEPLDVANILGEIASRVDSLEAKFKEKMQATNEKLGIKERTAKRSRHEPGSDSDSGPCNEPLGNIGHCGDGDVTVKNKMIKMLIEKNKRDEAKCESVMEEFKCLEKSIADRKKLIEDIKKVGC